MVSQACFGLQYSFDFCWSVFLYFAYFFVRQSFEVIFRLFWKKQKKSEVSVSSTSSRKAHFWALLYIPCTNDMQRYVSQTAFSFSPTTVLNWVLSLCRKPQIYLVLMCYSDFLRGVAAGDRTQCVALARQVLFLWAKSPTPVTQTFRGYL